MDDTQKQIIGALDKANNVLVTVSRNPSVDQLSAAIGLTLALNKLGKHAIAVFSGDVPSTIEFLQPEKTLEKTTDSLRDFIISLDKAKADKLRYKVENDMVKIFITPYKTSLSQDDLEFSQGDFNVEVVMALGVHEQTDLDQAITSHGRILHDATVVGVNVSGESRLGSINWQNPGSSSLSEMVAAMVPKLKENILDNQMATAFLTGIVAETERFSNDRTSPATMQVSSQLMAAGANQQLVATQLEQPGSSGEAQNQGAPAPSPQKDDGSLEIDHDASSAQQPAEEPKEQQPSQIHIDEHGQLGEHPGEQPQDMQPAPESAPDEQPQEEPKSSSRRPMALTPPTTGGKLTANTEPEGLSPSTDVFGDGATRSSDDKPNLSRRAPQPDLNQNRTLSEIEEEVSSPHVMQQAPQSAPPAASPELPAPQQQPEESSELPRPDEAPPAPQPSPEETNHLESARNAVMAAMDNQNGTQQPAEPAPQSDETLQSPAPEEQTLPALPPTEAQVSEDGTLTVHPPENPEPFGPPTQPNVTDPNAPPEVPPPFLPPNYPPSDNRPQ